MGYNGGMSAAAKRARAKPRKVKTVKEFFDWVEGLSGQLLLYRGLADVTWDVEAAACRRIKNSKDDLKSYTTQLLDTARMRGFRTHEGRTLFELELLARLQHLGAATCLIDFTRSPWVALWFACQPSEQDGKVVVLGTIKTNATTPGMSASANPWEGVGTINSDLLEREVERLLNDEVLWKWEPSPLESRVLTQQSTFVFGQETIDEQHYEEVHISSSKKDGICDALSQKLGINEERLFSDFAGFALANAHDKPYKYEKPYVHKKPRAHGAPRAYYIPRAYRKSEKEYSADDHFALAESSSLRGDYEKAMQHCDKAIGKNPKHVEAHHLRGWCNYFMEKWQEGIDDLSRAIEIDATHMQSFMLRGQIYASGLKKPQKAVDDYTAVIDFLSTSKRGVPRRELPAAYRRRGWMYANLEEHQTAIADFTSALEIRPHWTHVYYERAESHRALGNEREARADEEEAERVKQLRRRRFVRKR